MFKIFSKNFKSCLVDFHGKRLFTHWAKHNEKVKQKQRKSELKSTDQILKARIVQEKKRQKQSRRIKAKSSRKSKK